MHRLRGLIKTEKDELELLEKAIAKEPRDAKKEADAGEEPPQALDQPINQSQSID